VVIATVTLPGALVRQYEHLRDHSPNHERRGDAERVLEDLRSLCRAAQAFEEQHEDATLTGFLDHAAELHAQEVDAATDHRVTVSTIHRAKGAEAALVLLLGCEQQLLPSWRSLSSPDPGRLEEERRLFYVAATRAKDRLIITTRPSAGAGRPAARRNSSTRPGCSNRRSGRGRRRRLVRPPRRTGRAARGR
jgi:DNA helicase-2/ATP-dependent DNA helicase PcrA